MHSSGVPSRRNGYSQKCHFCTEPDFQINAKNILELIYIHLVSGVNKTRQFPVDLKPQKKFQMTVKCVETENFKFQNCNLQVIAKTN